MVPRLFTAKKKRTPLTRLYDKIHELNIATLCGLEWAFEARDAPSWEGEVLAYVAQMIRNEGTKAVSDRTGYKPNIVVVATLIVHEDTPIFVIGLNGHERERKELLTFQRAIVPTIAGVKVVVVSDQVSPSESTQTKRLPWDVDPWSWHGEQKTISYVKKYYGPAARATLTALGVAHIWGPCSADTAKAGSNACDMYLGLKYEKDAKRLVHRSVAAYWYKQDTQNQTIISYASLNSLKDPDDVPIDGPRA